MNHSFNPILIFILSFFGALPLIAQVNADFSSNMTSGCSPIAVLFSDQSNSSGGAITSWSWTNNGNFFSDEQNPSILLTQSGLYDICLTATNSSGQSDTRCRNNFIEVFTNPTAEFSANNTIGCPPFSVDFTSQSIPGSAALSQVIWDFGGSCGVVIASPQEVIPCTYNSTGNFQVTLIVEDANGCTANLTIPNYIQVEEEPVVDVQILPYDDCEPPFLVDFQNNGDPALTYNWDLGNGNTFIGFTPPTTNYSTSGPFEIVVTALDPASGCSVVNILDEQVEELFPLDFNFLRSGDCTLPVVSFLDESGGVPDLISWDFGDGMTSMVSNPVHTFPGFGCFDVTLTRTVGNCTKSLSQQVCFEEINPANIITNFTNPTGCELPHQSSFSVVPNPNFSYLWDFGDGNTSTNTVAIHSYSSYGEYDVTLSVTDMLGCETILDVGLIQVQPITMQLGSFGSLGCIPLQVSMDPAIQSFEPITLIDWQVFDGGGLLVFQSGQTNPSFTLNSVGCYDVQATIENADGCQLQETITNAWCAGEAPLANFSFDPPIGCASTNFSFTDLSQGSVDTWIWDFQGDGSPEDFVPDPTYEYPEIGCFMPTLSVAQFGCFDQISLGPLCVEPPVARFNVSYSCDTATWVTFNNTSIEADSVAWDFGVVGDSTDTSSMDTTQYLYPGLGEYTLTLIAYNFMTGCSDTATAMIEVEEPVALFSLASTELCAPATVNPVDASVGAVAYTWSLPNGGTLSQGNTAAPQINFETPGTYSIQLEVENQKGCFNTYILEDILVNSPVIGFQHQVIGNCVPFTVVLEDNSSNPFAENLVYEWSFLNGEIQGTGENFQFNLDTVGIFPIQLTVEDSWGCRDSIIQSVGFNEDAPVAYFNGLLFGCEAVDIVFNNLSLGTGLTYSWEFGDGSTSSEFAPEHNFQDGEYEVCLTIQDASCIDTHCDSVFIQPIESLFSVVSTYSSCVPSPVKFVNESINGVSYVWNFGDDTGESDSEQASHIYTNTGTYDVSLVAVGVNPGCTDTLLLQEAVSVNGPGGQVDFLIDDFCVPAEITVEVSSDRPYDMTVFFGDGNVQNADSLIANIFQHSFETTTNDGFVPSVLMVESNNPDCFVPINSPDTFFLASLEAEIMADRMILCDENREVVLESLVESSTGNFNSEWLLPGAMPPSSTQPDLVTTYSEPGFYDVTFIVENEECQDTLYAESFIEVYEVAQFLVPDYLICEGDSVILEAEGDYENFSWNNETFLTDPGDINPIAFPDETME
ncbi:MAG: PKD domain-containing protein, partial [Saprospiraceae bacterium]|nr:PKD domain-containing protein [Saprospiraceae bacterium]